MPEPSISGRAASRPPRVGTPRRRDGLLGFVRIVLAAVALASQVSPCLGAEIDPESISEFVEFEFIKNGANARDLSGIAWYPGNRSYFLIQNTEGNLYEVDRNFRFMRAIFLDGIGDSEEIVFLRRKRVNGSVYPEIAIAEESGKISILLVTEQNRYDVRRDAQQFQLVLDGDRFRGNKGIEGLAYDRRNRVFYAAKERDPIQIFKFERPAKAAGRSIEPQEILKATSLEDHIDDVSGLHFNPRTGRLLILSHESHRLLDVRTTGEIVSTVVLPKYIPRPLWLDRKSKYEGVTMNRAGQIILTSEPYHYQRALIPALNDRELVYSE